MKVKSIGEFPAFPMGAHRDDVIEEFGVRSEDGMTYRQWLVAHVAAGLAANPHVGAARIVDLAFQLTDEMIGRLEASEHSDDL